MHSLRHTLASLLLENDTPITTISDILGHIDTDSTTVYLKVDIKKLKEEKQTFKQNVLPKWIEAAEKREAGYSQKVELKLMN